MRYDPRGIEKLIQDAQQEGKFDDLACKGQPLQVAFGDLASVANDVMRDNGIVPEWITLSREIEALRTRQSELTDAYARRRAADAAELAEILLSWTSNEPPSQPGWRGTVRRWWTGARASRSRERARPQDLVARAEQDRQRTLFRFAALVRAERKKVERYNLILDVGGRQMRRVRVDERLGEFQEQFPAQRLIQDAGGWCLQERVEAIDPALLRDGDEPPPHRPSRAPEQAQALHDLRRSTRRPPPMG